MIVITTPTGQIGRQVLGNLLDSGEQLRVIARDPSKLPAGVRKDLDIVEGSHGDAAVVDKAFAGADAVLWLTPGGPAGAVGRSRLPGFTGPAAEAFSEARRRARRRSLHARPRHALGRPGRLRHRLAGDLGRPHRGQRRGLPRADQPLLHGRYAPPGRRRSGTRARFFSPIAGDRKLPAVATRGIAAAASRLLRDEQAGAVTGEVPLPGPEDLSFNDMAGIIGRGARPRTCCFRRTTFEAYKGGFIRLGMSDAMAQGYTDLAWAKDQGLDNGVQRTPQNSTPTSFRQWCEQVLKPAVAA